MGGVVTAVSCSAGHTLVKQNRDSIRLLAGLGVEGDAHLGASVKHRSRLARFSKEPNLRQVHLIHAELHDELRERGFAVSAGQMGESVTTRSIDLLWGCRPALASVSATRRSSRSRDCATLAPSSTAFSGA